MNFHLKGQYSVILMSVRKGAPYSDKTEEDGKILIYEGHDISRKKDGPNPKKVDQPLQTPNGKPTQNCLFYEAAKNCKNNSEAELIKVYEKIKSGIWVYNGFFKLVDAWDEISNKRRVFKFRLDILEDSDTIKESKSIALDHNRLIPTSVKLDVWKRDNGQCTKCHSKDNLHFDHIIPYSKGGSSLVSKNIQLLCARHNLEKKAKIE